MLCVILKKRVLTLNARSTESTELGSLTLPAQELKLQSNLLRLYQENTSVGNINVLTRILLYLLHL